MAARISARKQLALQRTASAVQMRLRGKSYSDIAAVLGISRQAAHALVTKAFHEVRTQTAEETDQLRQIELARLEELHEKFAPLADPHGLAQAGEIDAMDSAKKAADVVLKTSERRSKLLGLDAPTKSEIAGKDGAPLVTGVFAIPQSQPSVDAWAQSAQQSVAPSPAPELPAPPQP